MDLNQRDSDTLPEYHQLDQVLDQIMIQKIPLNECMQLNDKETVEFVVKQLRNQEFDNAITTYFKGEFAIVWTGWQYPIGV